MHGPSRSGDSVANRTALVSGYCSTGSTCVPSSGIERSPARSHRLFRHHAARQRGAMFKTRDAHEAIGCFATTLLASVERCSRPEMPTKPSAVSPPRCSPAWSGVQDQRCPGSHRLFRHHAARQRGAVFKTRDAQEAIGCFATTLLASVERCSRPEMPLKPSAVSPPRCSPAWSDVQDQRCPRSHRLFRHHAARQRGAVFKMLNALSGSTTGAEHGSTLASSVVASEAKGLGRRLVLNTAPRWQAAWWPRRSRGGTTAGTEHGSTLASSVVAEEEDVAWSVDGWY